jgi:hypothetical protein
MRRLAVKLLAVTAGLAAAGAHAEKTLYAKCNPTKVQKDPKGSASTLATLKPGDEVVWEGPSPSKPYHKVKANNQEGFIDQACLTKSHSEGEFASSGGAAISADAFKSSAAATKGLSTGAITYANEKGPDKSALAAQIIYVEENTKNRTSPGDKEFVGWAKKAGVKFAAKGAK